MSELELSSLILDRADKEKLKVLCATHNTSMSEVTRLLHKALIQGKIKISDLKLNVN
jgi:hypothetical protein